jgi:hypothetical protein
MTTAVQSPGILTNWRIAGRPLPSSVMLADPIRDPLNLFLAAGASALIICGMVAVHNEMLDWYLLPVFLCGALIGPDMFAWLRGKVDTFDPLGILGAYGYFFFFLAPLLTVMWSYHTAELPEPPDWLSWIGWMSVLNVFGLLIYLIARGMFSVQKPRTIWVVKPASFFGVMSVAVPLALAFQLYIFIRFDGVFGFMTAFSDANTDAFNGMGWQFLIAEMFPVFVAILFLVWKRDALRARSWAFLALLVFGFFVLKLLCGGLRGSRSNTVWAMFWLVGAIHLWVKRVPRRLIVLGLVFLALFMYLYGFYKQEGVRAFDAIQDRSQLELIAEKNGRTVDAALLGDMARTEIQSYLLYRLWAIGDYDYGYGTTYLEAFDVLIPKWIWPDRPDGKVRKGTEALHGRAVYNARIFQASQVYGLAGEAMLNFPPILAPLAFFALAFVVAKSRTLMLADPDDLRWLLVPILANAMIILPAADLDNQIMFFLTVAACPLLLLRASCVVVPRQPQLGTAADQ